MTDVLDLLAPGDWLARPDLADQALEGLVRADAYRKTEAMHCRVAVADILSDRDDPAPRRCAAMSEGTAGGAARRGGA